MDQTNLISTVIMLILELSFAGLFLAGWWKVFTKAGQPGWKVLIPVYDYYILLKIIGRPGWWLLLLLVPLVNIGITIVVALDLAKSFGRSGVFGFFMLWMFSFIGYLILGFGKSKYLGPIKQVVQTSEAPPQEPTS